MPEPPHDAIIIAEYDPAWPVMFEEERERLHAAIGAWAERIEHVGSTAIPGIGAKPIIDIGVALRSFEDALYCITPLVELGYDCLGEFGIPRRIYFRKRTGTPVPGQVYNDGVGRTHQVHMYEQTHEQFVNHIIFRDYLRANPEARDAYEALKRRLASELEDIERYADAKSDFIKDILTRARAGSPA